MKLIVTHTNPDLDAVASIWLIKRFWKGWENAEVKFVPAGETCDHEKLTNRQSRGYQVVYSEIIHVDTGLGEFDHHQTNEDTCSTKIVFRYMNKAIRDRLDNPRKDPPASSLDGKLSVQSCLGNLPGVYAVATVEFNSGALERMVNFINDVDHFRQVYYPNPTADYYDFLIVGILDGLNLIYNNKGEGDIQVVEHGMICLDGIYKVFKNKVNAEEEIKNAKYEMQKIKQGKIIGFETRNDAVLEVAQKMGYVIVVRKDPKKGYVRIKALPDSGIDLTPIYNKLKRKDKKATWFLHISKKMLLNGTVKNPKMKPTNLNLKEIMNVIGGGL